MSNANNRNATIPDNFLKKVANSTDIPASIKTILAGKLKALLEVVMYCMNYQAVVRQVIPVLAANPQQN